MELAMGLASRFSGVAPDREKTSGDGLAGVCRRRSATRVRRGQKNFYPARARSGHLLEITLRFFRTRRASLALKGSAFAPKF